ncbi:protein Wnt-16-like [Gigantopelta aegis]|uniref:protein Wnt-16-like n=1 Tax=Gigantopelta aegis TaxID=1735272 RepID=UPI001B889FB4|nr:protein Wnt-16-like [Gigantopelta aegis]
MECGLIAARHWIKLILLVALLAECRVFASWMYLGVASLAGALHDNTCNEVPGLVIQQLEVCKNNPESLLCVSEGARRGIIECQAQFKYERWNCTTDSNHTVFGPVLKRGTKETAFIYSILSAGVVHAVTRSCSAGNLTDCSCDMSRYGEADVEGWKWGGCSDNVKYGLWFSKTFVDAPETIHHQSTRNIRNLMNLHNNQVGRKVVEKLMRLKCRCHGVSGSCAVKTCWKGLPSFREVGSYLKTKYEVPVRLARRSRKRLRRKEKSKRRVPIGSDELVYVHRSPNYCREDPKRGILGTRARLCNRTSTGGDSCDLLCCGRGYNTQVVRYVERCHCKFFWCCYVKCKTCETMIDLHTCK